MTTKSELAEAIVIDRTLNAPVARVWEALNDVDQIRHWYFDLKEFKPKAGFEFEFVVEHEGHNYHHLCRVTEVIPQRNPLLHSPCDFLAGKKFSFPQKKRIRVR